MARKRKRALSPFSSPGWCDDEDLSGALRPVVVCTGVDGVVLVCSTPNMSRYKGTLCMKSVLALSHQHAHTRCTTKLTQPPMVATALMQAAVKKWCDDSSVDLVLTSGGTGFGRRDLTPEAIRPLLHRLETEWLVSTMAREAADVFLFCWSV